MQSEATLENQVTSEQQPEPMTFQIGMVGSDGLVVASDSLHRYAALNQFSQRYSADKYIASPGGSLICFMAGTDTAVELAMRISRDCDRISTVELEAAIRRTALEKSQPGLIPDEVLVVRTDSPDAFWFISRTTPLISQFTVPPVVSKVATMLCIGAKTPALFLPRHLWSPNRTVAELKKLALLTLSCAAIEEPGAVGPPFVVMTLDKSGGVEWTHYDRPEVETFQKGLDSLLANSRFE